MMNTGRISRPPTLKVAESPEASSCPKDRMAGGISGLEMGRHNDLLNVVVLIAMRLDTTTPHQTTTPPQ